MGDTLAIALTNLTSPMVLFFALGLAAALARSDLALPEAVAKALALYLMLAIGFKGGVGVAAHGVDAKLIAALAAGAVLSALIPLVAFGILSLVSDLPRADRAAVAGHYGSISIVTLVAATETMKSLGLDYEGYLVAVAAVMETPAILTALWLAARGRKRDAAQEEENGSLFREIALNGSIVVLVGAFAIGLITGEKGLADIAPFIVDPFKGILCLFLLDMGVIAGRGLRAGYRSLTPAVIVFGLTMPLIGAVIAAPAAWAIGLSAGGAALLLTLAASASYIAVPAAMRVALPEARPAIYLTLSLGVTFPFNLTVGIPLYAAIGQYLTG
ncbi:sodium-dependent bicarbonate transport family permease [Stappia stellulata]|uniref:sodium-dependent bicarbonate transport family permease n=1 Tax=Stappia TaxID=152161 RepID=UPI001CD7DA27|nr:sodium-dependent bicarbonate transport family permease [Stappia stellulata]MCA1243100.1 sodium-dependent bicarbonate transport family permease [Stappia stellulata]